MKKNISRISIYAAFITAMVFSGLQVGRSTTTASAEATCCTYGQDCTTKSTPRCCVPLNEADCSEAKKFYCRLRCS